MYVPRFNAVEDETELRAMVAELGAGELITTGPDGYPSATLLPVVWEGDRVIAHFARANPQWTTIEPDAPALLVCSGAQAYVSPAWYATKAEHGRVVPTWNYSSVHLTGRLRIHDDVAWLRGAVTTLTDHHETGRDERWHVTDAPAAYIDGQLRGIVGVELVVEKVEGKAKLSQNRSEEDRRGVVAGLGSTGSPEDGVVAGQMRSGLT
ncbi:FMN-binding negative transcriptional regulator [Nocardioides marmorisolisilvae]|uniref:FMN-binding negative transcriptional regulator n=1 Tax=Nocardioides marmorisolisilvae TaxID=1542737 RepID=A0A3N0DR23_9ACTN|nr:FMN-binding negative transcriptional regulator [Nocardioides marmorisolisilvae]RNL77783.1 FMN-binding negative transcriptional regulator [Nocardioides marmorisolisilvae]